MANITGINPPQRNDVGYVQKIIDSFTAVDNHDHSSGKGLAVARVAAGVVDATALASDAVTTAKILNANVTKAKLAALGQQISSNSGNFSTSSVTYVDVTNLSVSITTTGRPVFIAMIMAGGGSISSLFADQATFSLDRNGSSIAEWQHTNSSGGMLYGCGIGQFHVDPVGAGTYTYKIQAKKIVGADVWVSQYKLLAFEIG